MLCPVAGHTPNGRSIRLQERSDISDCHDIVARVLFFDGDDELTRPVLVNGDDERPIELSLDCVKEFAVLEHLDESLLLNVIHFAPPFVLCFVLVRLKPVCLSYRRNNISTLHLWSSRVPVPLPHKTSRHAREEFRTHVGEHKTHTHPNSFC